MKWLGIADSVGAPWAHSFRGWLALLIPTTVIVLLLEAHTPFPHFGLVLLSAIVQHCCAGLVVLPLVAVFRNRADVLPFWAVFTSWTVGAVTRAVTGAAIAGWFADAEIDLQFRVVSWLLVAWTWMPLLSYAVAQLENRQRLLGARSGALRSRDAARERRSLTVEQIRTQLVSDVSVSAMTVIAEIEAALDASRHQLDANRLELVGDRLSDVSAHLGRAVGRLSEGRDAIRSEPVPAAAPMMAALNFQREHPWRWSILSAVALAAVMMPIAFEANREVLQSIAELESERDLLELTALENENRIRQELYDVMHGPILGRLSSCAMALNFLAAEADAVPRERITTVTTAVLDHLSQTMQDLSLLKR